jgi:hypothetical protein
MESPPESHACPQGDGHADAAELRQQQQRAELTELILAAYAIAKDAGKDDWREMRAGVLKNRLLLITDGEFSEAKYGGSSFVKLLESLSGVVVVDRSITPPMVTLTAPDSQRDELSSSLVATSHSPTGSTRNLSLAWRIRSDLWSAVVDVDSAQAYVWDSGVAKLITKDDGSSLDRRPQLPTLTSAEMAGLQRDFAAGYHSEGVTEEIQKWTARETTTWSLPRHVRDAWFNYLKRQVRIRLASWFEQNHIDAPADLIEPGRSNPSLSRRAPDEATSNLRALVVRCVEVMTRSELESLNLPPAAVLRAHR